MIEAEKRKKIAQVKLTQRIKHSKKAKLKNQLKNSMKPAVRYKKTHLKNLEQQPQTKTHNINCKDLNLTKPMLKLSTQMQ